jgi:hypothetical protein
MSEKTCNPFSDARDCTVHSKDVRGKLYTETERDRYTQAAVAAKLKQVEEVLKFCIVNDLTLNATRNRILALSPTDDPPAGQSGADHCDSGGG